MLTRQVDALAVLDAAAVFHPAHHVGAIYPQHRQADKAVIQQNGSAGHHVPGQVPIGNRAAVHAALAVVGGKGELLALREHCCAAFKGAQTDLRSLGVQQCGHRQVHLLPQSLEGVQPFFVLFVAAVGEVEPGHIHARKKHIPQDLRGIGGGPQSADDFCFTHAQFTSAFSIILSGKDAREPGTLS